jgi:hypothetical protein
MQRIANGSKHFVRSEQKASLKSGGYGEGGYGVGGYGTASLQIEVMDAAGDSTRLDAQGLIEDVLIFWREFFKKHSPYKDNMPKRLNPGPGAIPLPAPCGRRLTTGSAA